MLRKILFSYNFMGFKLYIYSLNPPVLFLGLIRKIGVQIFFLRNDQLRNSQLIILQVVTDMISSALGVARKGYGLSELLDLLPSTMIRLLYTFK